jgi:hypothetical protein
MPQLGRSGSPGKRAMQDKMERYMLKELLAIIAALSVVSAVLLTVVIAGNQ